MSSDGKISPRVFCAIIITGVILLLTPWSWGLNGLRKGFVFEAGVGGGLTKFESNMDLRQAFSADLNLGYAINHQMGFLLINKFNWFDPGKSSPDNFLINTLNALGLRYYFEDDSTSAYMTLGAGIAGLSRSFIIEPKSWNWPGVVIGFGVELGWVIGFNIDFMYTKADYQKLPTKNYTGRLLAVVMFY